MLKILVVDVVIVEPVSTPKFPSNRDINRKFRQISSLCEILNADTRAISKAFGKIPYATEQGVLLERFQFHFLTTLKGRLMIFFNPIPVRILEIETEGLTNCPNEATAKIEQAGSPSTGQHRAQTLNPEERLLVKWVRI